MDQFGDWLGPLFLCVAVTLAPIAENYEGQEPKGHVHNEVNYPDSVSLAGTLFVYTTSGSTLTFGNLNILNLGVVR